MTEARDIPDAIDWHDGMLLAPQHFQQQALRHERQLTYHVRQARPFHWGVVHLQVDRVQLVSGLVQVRELEAILPDGIVVDYRAGSDEPPAVGISASAEPGGQPQVTITLPVPHPPGEPAP
ncbi:type VI secretion system baseplate subunit TssK, partial [Azospirillum brasilense]|nr:type VI secretion system baseplate subunit TssK [Azospirillum brasilense]